MSKSQCYLTILSFAFATFEAGVMVTVPAAESCAIVCEVVASRVELPPVE